MLRSSAVKKFTNSERSESAGGFEGPRAAGFGRVIPLVFQGQAITAARKTRPRNSPLALRMTANFVKSFCATPH